MSWICPYELNALGTSSFCEVFTLKEWKKFNYARDLAAYYGSGYFPQKQDLSPSPGNQFGKVLGRPWIESLVELLKQNTSSNGDLYFSLYSSYLEGK
jgi:acid phosphatase